MTIRSEFVETCGGIRNRKEFNLVSTAAPIKVELCRGLSNEVKIGAESLAYHSTISILQP